MFAGLESGFCEGEMRIGGGGYDDDVDGGIGKHGVCGIVDFGIGVIGSGRVVGFRSSLDNGVEGEGGCDGD